jgi:hypothetical protein
LAKLQRARTIWKYNEALRWVTEVSGRFAYGFQTELNFADVVMVVMKMVIMFVIVIVVTAAILKHRWPKGIQYEKFTLCST